MRRCLRPAMAALVAGVLLPGCLVIRMGGGGDGNPPRLPRESPPVTSPSFGGGTFEVRGNGNVVTESREVSGVDRLRVSGAAEVLVEQTGTESLSIEAEENLLPLLVSEVSGGVLTLGVRPNSSISATRPIVFRLTVESLSAVDAGGAGTIDAKGLDVPSLRYESSGTVKATFAGNAPRQEVTLSGTARFDGRNLSGSEATVEVSGSAEAVVNVSERLRASAGGTGEIRYAGAPEVEDEVSGVGRVEPL